MTQMNYEEWEALRESNPNEYVKLYRLFQNDIRNEYRCSGCPNNWGCEPGADDKLPCGQYRCWQTVANERP